MPTDLSGIDPPSGPLLPANVRAEQALLGAILTSNKVYDTVSYFLRADHFIDPTHNRIYAAIAVRIEGGRLADAISLKSDFENTPVLDEVGGPSYLGQLLVAMVGINNALEYGRAIHDAWRRRCLITIGQILVFDGYASDGRSAAEVHEAAEASLYDLGERGEIEEARSPAHEAMALAIDGAVKAAEQPEGLVGLTTGFQALDEITGGWRRGHYAILAGRPSMGKTTLGLGMSAAAAETGARVLFASMEMSREAIGGVLAAGLSQLPRDAGDRGRVREPDGAGGFSWRAIAQPEIDRMVAAQRTMAGHTLVIDECRSHSVQAIRAQARRMKRRGGLDLVVIDYLGLLQVPELARAGNRTLEVSRLSAAAKALAIEMDIPVVMLCQLNRGPEGREDKRPTTADLRDSGSLEQDADLILFIYREHFYLQNRPPLRIAHHSDEDYANAAKRWATARTAAEGVADIIVAKQRRGRVGTVRLGFNEATHWFTDFLPGEQN
jgi:replicative DNA helicase